ncbi:MAG: bifunctional nuclease family protein [Planctomycetota bacterium]|jgi:bifunctional DNase/RNase
MRTTAALAVLLLATAARAEEKPPKAADRAEDKAPKGTHRAEVAGVEAVDVTGTVRVRLRAKTKDPRSTVDILVGPAEGAAIYRGMSGQSARRPMTHDLLATVVSLLGGRITRLTVTRLEPDAEGGGVFIGELVVTHDGKEHKIDTRPSDGMALAVAAGIPIYVADEVLKAAGQPDDTEEDKKKEKEEDAEAHAPRPFGPPRELI